MKTGGKDFRGRKEMERASAGVTGMQCVFCGASGVFSKLM